MNHDFYDVKTKGHVKAAIIEVKTYGDKKNPRYQVIGKTKDGRKVFSFVGAELAKKAKEALKK
ncbi:MAG: hypothetical protein MJ025_00695 [Victivallaceae bacterium]|nr:hypothetical protein [Victivallaceae bacterium]